MAGGARLFENQFPFRRVGLEVEGRSVVIDNLLAIRLDLAMEQRFGFRPYLSIGMVFQLLNAGGVEVSGQDVFLFNSVQEVKQAVFSSQQGFENLSPNNGAVARPGCQQPVGGSDIVVNVN